MSAWKSTGAPWSSCARRTKIAGRYRSQILVKLPRREHAGARAAIRAMLKDEELLRSTTVDVDPMSVL